MTQSSEGCFNLNALMDNLVPQSPLVAPDALTAAQVAKLPPNTVVLNVYALGWFNSFLKRHNLGAYQSGVQVYGTEYAYAGATRPVPGIFRMKPASPGELGGPGEISFWGGHVMGQTLLSATQVAEKVKELERVWQANQYHLIQRNCHNFAQSLCTVLLGRQVDLPPYVNRWKDIAHRFPGLVNWLPKYLVAPLAFRQQLRTRFGGAKDGGGIGGAVGGANRVGAKEGGKGKGKGKGGKGGPVGKDGKGGKGGFKYSPHKYAGKEGGFVKRGGGQGSVGFKLSRGGKTRSASPSDALPLSGKVVVANTEGGFEFEVTKEEE